MQRRSSWIVLIASTLIWTAQPVSAWNKRTRPSPSKTYSPLLPIAIGAGF